ncbi:MAG TPA: hypothetical protein VNT27_06310, partial [Propionibacteriaceae bacterium]|nr:hypothetical protein [Propionibacteriaceae bacterium]
ASTTVSTAASNATAAATRCRPDTAAVETVMLLLLARSAHPTGPGWSTIRQPGQRGATRAG